LTVTSRTSPIAWRASNARFNVSIARFAGAVAAAREERRRVRHRRAVEGQHRAVARLREAADGAAAGDRDQGGRCIGGIRGQPPQPDPPAILDDAEQGTGVGRPRGVLDLPVEPRCERPGASRAALPHHQATLIIERALRIVRMKRERVTIGRIDRRGVVGSGSRGQDALSPRREIDRHDVPLIHHPRLGPRSTARASSRPSGAMSKSSALGSHGGSARPVPESASRQRPVATSQT
jgi:hypothetical protein